MNALDFLSLFAELEGEFETRTVNENGETIVVKNVSAKELLEEMIKDK